MSPKCSVKFFCGVIFVLCGFGCANTPYAKMFKYGNSDIYDYKIFPARKLSASTTPYHLPTNLIADVNFRKLQDSLRLNQLLEENKTSAFVVIHNDSVVFEKYFSGLDSSFVAQYFSMSKSVMSLLIGCAIDDRLISSENDFVVNYIPELSNRGFNGITLRELMDMTAPVNYTENDNPFGKHAKFYFTPHLEKDILKLTARENDERKFVYRSSNTAILGLVLKRILKNETISEYTQRKIWLPLAMEADGLWTIDHEGDGIERTWCCLAGTARDFSKIASLYLNGGTWKDKKIVSPVWIDKTLEPLKNKTNSSTYNLGWWFFQEKNSFMAIGKDGQFAYLSPEKKVAIVRLGEKPGKLKRKEWVELFSRIAEVF